MDCLLRLLSKKHSAFKEFAHQFSETLFIQDKDDEANVTSFRSKKYPVGVCRLGNETCTKLLNLAIYSAT
jgi:hypothetical protein